ncbi:MAG: hypothetical protein ABDH23_04375 [Endomicrobiia bacterium]
MDNRIYNATDANPNGNLGFTLEFPKELKNITLISELKHLIEERTKSNLKT